MAYTVSKSRALRWCHARGLHNSPACDAFAAWAAEQSPTVPTDPAGIQHGLYCFDSLYSELSDHQEGTADLLNTILQKAIGDAEFPLFVTWNSIRSEGSPRLRGCIGNFAPSPLNEGLKDYALISALEDHRFNPITLKDLNKLTCTVSLLHTFEDCQTFTDWTIGQHGIYIHIPDPSQPITSNASSEPLTPSSQSHPNPTSPDALANVLSEVQSSVRNRPRSMKHRRMLSATYLPDVAAEQGWTKTEAIDSAIRKAGWDGPITPTLRSSLIIERYQSSKCTVSHQDWKAWRARLAVLF